MSRDCELMGCWCDDDRCEEGCMEEYREEIALEWKRSVINSAEILARDFLEIRTRLAPSFGQVVRIPEWDELPEGLRLLTVAAMREALEKRL